MHACIYVAQNIGYYNNNNNNCDDDDDGDDDDDENDEVDDGDEADDDDNNKVTYVALTSVATTLKGSLQQKGLSNPAVNKQY